MVKLYVGVTVDTSCTFDLLHLTVLDLLSVYDVLKSFRL